MGGDGVVIFFSFLSFALNFLYEDPFSKFTLFSVFMLLLVLLILLLFFRYFILASCLTDPWTNVLDIECEYFVSTSPPDDWPWTSSLHHKLNGYTLLSSKATWTIIFLKADHFQNFRVRIRKKSYKNPAMIYPDYYRFEMEFNLTYSAELYLEILEGKCCIFYFLASIYYYCWCCYCCFSCCCSCCCLISWLSLCCCWWCLS